MKKVILSSVLLSGLVLVSFATVDAAQVVGKTQGQVKFVPNDGETEEPKPGAVNVIKPGTHNQIIELDDKQGVSSKGPIRIAYVPNINFGDAKVSVMKQEYPAKVVKYKFSDGEDKTDKYIPPFIQVIDERGGATGFKISLKASKFESDDNHVLDGTQIKIAKAVLKNQATDKAGTDASTLLDGVADNTLIGEGEKTIMSTKVKGPGTNNAASSLVFDGDYTAAKVYNPTDVTQGLKLVVPQGDQPKVNTTYKADLTWTLSDAQ